MRMHSHTHTHANAQSHTHTHTHPHARSHTHARPHTQTQPHAWPCTCTVTHIHMQMHGHTHIHIHTHMHGHTHSHTQRRVPARGPGPPVRQGAVPPTRRSEALGGLLQHRPGAVRGLLLGEPRVSHPRLVAVPTRELAVRPGHTEAKPGGRGHMRGTWVLPCTGPRRTAAARSGNSKASKQWIDYRMGDVPSAPVREGTGADKGLGHGRLSAARLGPDVGGMRTERSCKGCGGGRRGDVDEQGASGGGGAVQHVCRKIYESRAVAVA
jgi:hypothetical protein